ncbi:MAG: 16S rRNA (adenine(1518)-N(6)/adenine(1519)-N(6))-dimethyltransferase RsmA [Clostridia bacterium]|nr:16S rRNA (adenine(1518)-N(6)/adenine(1519)-N(6))-dimethyltransferase RsmA [Clostridia bacterium]
MRASLSFVKEFFNASGTNPNRALGQNFCIDFERLSLALNGMELSLRPVLEIGAGLGALTEILLAKGARVTAIELDSLLANALREGLECEVVQADALKLDTGFIDERWAVMGNLPYHITSPLLERYLSTPAKLHLYMVQKEAGERFFALPGDKNYCPVSIISQLYYTPKLLFELSPQSYYPAPSVSSVIVCLTARDDAPSASKAGLIGFARRCLAMRRKTLKNNLRDVPELASVLSELGLRDDVRAEALSPEQFLQLYLNVASGYDIIKR